MATGKSHSGSTRTNSPLSTCGPANRSELAAMPTPLQAMRASTSGELAVSRARRLRSHLVFPRVSVHGIAPPDRLKMHNKSWFSKSSGCSGKPRMAM